MIGKNEYNLANEKDREDLYDIWKERGDQYPFSKYKFNIIMDFLSKYLREDWFKVTNIKIGHLICPNSVKTGNNHYSTIGIVQLYDIGKNLMHLLNICDIKKHFIHKANTVTHERLSTIEEICSAGSYVGREYPIVLEPSNNRLGKSGKYGKCDFKVELNGRSVFFEVTTDNINDSKAFKTIQNYSTDSSLIDFQKEVEKILPSNQRVDLFIRNKSKLVEPRWRAEFLSKLSNAEPNKLYLIQGNEFAINVMTLEEGKLRFNIALSERARIKRILRVEKDQIPRGDIGAIVIQTGNLELVKKLSQGLLSLTSFRDIESIIIIDNFGQSVVVMKNIIHV